MINCNNLLSLGYRRRGEGTEWGSSVAEDEVLPDCDQSPSPLSLLFLRRLGGLPLLRGNPVCFQHNSIALSTSVCFPVCASVRVCLYLCQRIGADQLAGCNPYYTIYCLNHCSCIVVKFLAAKTRFRIARPLVQLFLGLGPPRSCLGSSCACRITRQRDRS